MSTNKDVEKEEVDILGCNSRLFIEEFINIYITLVASYVNVSEWIFSMDILRWSIIRMKTKPQDLMKNTTCVWWQFYECRTKIEMYEDSPKRTWLDVYKLLFEIQNINSRLLTMLFVYSHFLRNKTPNLI